MYDSLTFDAKDTRSAPMPCGFGGTVGFADGGQLRCWPRFFGTAFADNIYVCLRDAVPWMKVRFSGRPEPRLSAWVGNLSRRYGGTAKFVPHAELVERLAAIVAQVAFADAPRAFDGALLDWYRDGSDRIGFHAEDGPSLRPGAPVAMLSFGAARPFVLRHVRTGERHVVPVGAGSLLVTEAAALARWQRAIPAEPRCVGGTVTLTLCCQAFP